VTARKDRSKELKRNGRKDTSRVSTLPPIFFVNGVGNSAF